MRNLSTLGSIFLGLVMTASAQAQGRPLSGTYEVIQRDCDSTGILFPGQQVILQANNSRVRIGNIINLAEPDGHLGNRTEFESAFDFSVGTERVECLGDCYTDYTGSYSDQGNAFTIVQMTANTRAATPTYAGEIDFKLSADGSLEIDTTSGGQFVPVALTVCHLKKVD